MNTEVINHSFSARVKKGITTYFKENLAILVAFIILCVGLSIATPAFFTKDNILNVLRQVATNSNLAIGLTMAIIIGGIDLSVGAILAFSGLLCASFISDGMNLGLAVLLAFTLGALFGLLNGLIIAYTNMPPFVVTLATQNIARGIVNVYANGQPISARNPVFNFLGVGYFLGIPLPVIYSFVLLAVMILILGRSKFGRQLYAVGGNEEAARFSGINIKKLDKACLVFNIESENGYRVSILDKTNSTEAVYWTTDFLGLEQCEDNYFQTSNYLKLCKDFVQEVYNQENDIPKADQIDMLNRSIDYFKKADTFNENLFKEEVVSDPQIIDAFENFKNYYEEKNELALKDQFDVSNSAVKDEKKYFKHVLKLDKNFHVYIHGQKKYIEKGYDSDRDMNYYKLYFREEN